MPKRHEISQSTIERLSIYLRALRDFHHDGAVFISSQTLAERVGTSPAQIRKDLSCFGSFGHKGRGYDVEKLISGLSEILGVDKRWRVALIGFGKLGESLLKYDGFKKNGFDIVAIFEKDKKIVGKKCEGVPIYSVEDMPNVCGNKTILISIVAVPHKSAYEAIQLCLDAGIRAILNLSGQTGFKPPPHATIKDINLSAEIESLSYFLTNR